VQYDHRDKATYFGPKLLLDLVWPWDCNYDHVDPKAVDVYESGILIVDVYLAIFDRSQISYFDVMYHQLDDATR